MKGFFIECLFLLCLCCCWISDAAIFGYFAPEGKDASPWIDYWVNKTHTIQNFMTGWTLDEKVLNNLFNLMLKSWNEAHHIPMVTWMPYAWRNWTSPNPNEIIANGGYDDYLYIFAKRLKLFLAGPDGIFGTYDDRRVYLRFAHQMNGNWFPWSPSCSWSCEQNGQKIKQSATSYINMWKHVVDVFEDTGIHNDSRLQMVWTVNNINFQNPINEFYPGDYFVDWIGVDGYNFGNTIQDHNWESASTVFKDILTKVNLISNRPIAITEFGTVSSPNGLDAKVSWITDSFNIFKSNNISMVLCYNVDGDNKDFAIFGGLKGDEVFSYSSQYYNAISSYRNAMGDHWMIGANTSNIRLITDKQFITGE